jgi:hypothetical protein
MLLDGAVANTAVLGSSHDDAVVLVSRRLLDELDRDETQAVVGHLVGAAGTAICGSRSSCWRSSGPPRCS